MIEKKDKTCRTCGYRQLAFGVGPCINCQFPGSRWKSKRYVENLIIKGTLKPKTISVPDFKRKIEFENKLVKLINSYFTENTESDN